MNSKPQNFILIPTLLACFALGPTTQALTPPPDGAYPGGNTAEGQAALLSLTTGGFNTAVGFLSLRSDTTSNFNTAIGAGTLLANTADENTAVGTGALLSNTSGIVNTACGVFGLFSNTTGNFNTAFGQNALFSNTTGSSNTASGEVALGLNTSGDFNTAIGYRALNSNINGANNTAVGINALNNNMTGSHNIALGANAGANVGTAHNVICIGTGGQNVSDSFYVANVFETAIDPDNLPVRIDVTGRLGTQSSSRRFKDDIRPMDKASEVILALKPVTFHYKSDNTSTPQFGLIAEEVAQVNPDLVIRDKEGKPYSVRYDQVNAMLLNEFLKEHHTVEAQQGKIEEQQKQINAVAARLEQQAQLIEQVCMEVHTNKPAPTLIANRP
jgi:hypothetical protein